MITFIPADEAGNILMTAAHVVNSHTSTRKRKVAFNQFAATLRGLRLIDSRPCIYVALGSSAAGLYGIIVAQEERHIDVAGSNQPGDPSAA